MGMKIVGIQRNVSFQMNGQTYVGTNLWVTYPRNGVEGVVTEKIFCNKAKPELFQPSETMVLGDEIIGNYNRYGKYESIAVM